MEVATVIQRDTPIYSDWVATLDGYVNAEIQPRVSGYIIKQNYREGAVVRKGDVLFEIDPRPLKAALDQAKAQLAQAEAQLGKASLDVERDTPLAEARAIAQSQLDTEIQAKLGAQASVLAAKANVEQAELNMEFTKVTSLVSGIAGIAQRADRKPRRPELSPHVRVASRSDQGLLHGERAGVHGLPSPVSDRTERRGAAQAHAAAADSRGRKHLRTHRHDLLCRS